MIFNKIYGLTLWSSRNAIFVIYGTPLSYGVGGPTLFNTVIDPPLLLRNITSLWRDPLSLIK